MNQALQQHKGTTHPVKKGDVSSPPCLIFLPFKSSSPNLFAISLHDLSRPLPTCSIIDKGRMWICHVPLPTCAVVDNGKMSTLPSGQHWLGPIIHTLQGAIHSKQRALHALHTTAYTQNKQKINNYVLIQLNNINFKVSKGPNGDVWTGTGKAAHTHDMSGERNKCKYDRKDCSATPDVYAYLLVKSVAQTIPHRYLWFIIISTIWIELELILKLHKGLCVGRGEHDMTHTFSQNPNIKP